MTTALVDLAAYRGSWRSVSPTIGYYIHRGRVYLDIVLYNNPNDPLTQTLLTGLPAEARPAAPVHFTIPADIAETPYTQDVALQLPSSYAATLHTDGSLTLDDPVPDQLINTPSIGTYFYVDALGTHYARYLTSLTTALLLSNLNWPVASAADAFTVSTLGPRLDTADFTDIDAAYAAHTERVHLAGRVRANIDDADVLLSSLPPDATGGLSTHGNSMPVKRGADTFLAFIDVGANRVTLNETPIKPLGEPPYLSWAEPPWQTPFGRRSIATFQNFTSFVSTPGIDPDVPFFTGGAPGPGQDAMSGHVDYGTYSCASATCRTPGPAIPGPIVLRLGAILATVDPQPDWFMVHYNIGAVIRQYAEDGTCAGGDCGPSLFPNYGFSMGVSGGASMHLTTDDAVTPISLTGVEGGIEGFVVPDSPLYMGATGLNFDGSGTLPNNVPTALWKWGQLVGDLTFMPGGLVNVADWGASLYVVPLWELRQYALRAGDVLTLDGAGWVGVLGTPGATPGDVQTGEQPQGIRALPTRHPQRPYR